MHAMGSAGSIPVVTLLLDARADPNHDAFSSRLETAAAPIGVSTIGDRLESLPISHFTALHKCVWHGFTDMVQLLVEYGARWAPSRASAFLAQPALTQPTRTLQPSLVVRDGATANCLCSTVRNGHNTDTDKKIDDGGLTFAADFAYHLYHEGRLSIGRLDSIQRAVREGTWRRRRLACLMRGPQTRGCRGGDGGQVTQRSFWAKLSEVVFRRVVLFL